MRTSARMTGAVAAAAAVALLVSGCGSSDDGGDDTKEPTAEPEPTAEKTAGGDDADGEGDGGKGRLTGVWSAQPGGEKLVLTVVGDAVSLLRDKKMCSGRVTKTGDESALVLKCPGGIGEERTNGEVDAVGAKELKVTWNGGDTDTYARVAKAPAELPKNPRELDELPELPDELKKITEAP